MEAGFIAFTMFAMIIGILLGVLIRALIERKRSKKVETQGDIYVYYGESGDGPSLLLDYSVPIDDIASRKRVLFNVIVIR